jgi:hypothetical protein
MRANFTDLSSVEKYVLPTETYEARSDSVLAWKKNQKLGRFDPNALSPEEALRHQVEKDKTDIQTRGLLERLSKDHCIITLMTYLQELPLLNELLFCLHLRRIFDVAQFALLDQFRPFLSLARVVNFNRMQSFQQISSRSGSGLSWTSRWGRTTVVWADSATSSA